MNFDLIRTENQWRKARLLAPESQWSSAIERGHDIDE